MGMKEFKAPIPKWNPFNLDCAVRSCVVFAVGDDDNFTISGSGVRIERRIFGQFAFVITEKEASWDGSEVEWIASDLGQAIRVVHKAQSRSDGASWIKAAVLKSGRRPMPV